MGRSTVYNNIVTDELWRQVNEKNKDLVEEWMEYLSSIDRSPQTIKQYLSDIKQYFVWNLQKNKDKFFAELTKKDIMRYQNYLINTLNVSPSRIRRLKSTLSSISNYIESMLDDEEDWKDFRNIINKVPAPTPSKVREKTILSEDELQFILDGLIEDGEYQKACLIALASYSGARKAELIQFKVNYFDEKNVINGLYKTPETIRGKGSGVRGKQIYKYVIKNYFEKYLNLWLDKRKELGIDSEWLFVTKNKGKWNPIKTTTVDSWMNFVSKYCTKPIYAHLYRHFFVTLLAKSGIPAEVIRKISSWESVEMVKIYSDLTLEDEMDKYFSNDGLIKQDEKGIDNL